MSPSRAACNVIHSAALLSRVQLELVIETLIDLLDRLDGDPDLEATDDQEACAD